MSKSDNIITVQCQNEAFSVKERLGKDEQLKDVARETLGGTGAKVADVPQFQNRRRIAVSKRAVLDHRLFRVQKAGQR